MTAINARIDYDGNWIVNHLHESVTIPVSLVYRLAELPNNTTLYNASGANIQIDGYTEVSGVGIEPAINQFKVHYQFGYIKFNASNAGSIITVNYDGLGTVLLAEDINTFLTNEE